ncbi:hypothetical protein BGZ83_001004 [Gryganskiella cystojenkinii]|nr:hypothetical protein BGZ83_001004 [Gryganskiella cystojenkinii]
MARTALFFVALLAALMSFFVVSAQVLDAGTQVSSTDAPVESLVKRSCTYQGCRCYPGSSGLYCYQGGVYQCATDGECCYYGPRDSCRQCGKLSCP